MRAAPTQHNKGWRQLPWSWNQLLLWQFLSNLMQNTFCLTTNLKFQLAHKISWTFDIISWLYTESLPSSVVMLPNDNFKFVKFWVQCVNGMNGVNDMENWRSWEVTLTCLSEIRVCLYNTETSYLLLFCLHTFMKLI